MKGRDKKIKPSNLILEVSDLILEVSDLILEVEAVWCNGCIL